MCGVKVCIQYVKNVIPTILTSGPEKSLWFSTQRHSRIFLSIWMQWNPFPVPPFALLQRPFHCRPDTTLMRLIRVRHKFTSILLSFIGNICLHSQQYCAAFERCEWCLLSHRISTYMGYWIFVCMSKHKLVRPCVITWSTINGFVVYFLNDAMVVSLI